MVMDMTEGLDGRTVVCDNFFTCRKLAHDLKSERRMGIVGTVRKNRTEIPPVLLNTRKPLYHTEAVYDHELRICMISYMAKRRKPVVLLSTVHSSVRIDQSDQKKKPEANARRRHFLVELSKSLCKPLIDSRSRMPRGEHAVEIVRRLRGLEPSTSAAAGNSGLSHAPDVRKRARCQICPYNANRTKVATRCDSCLKYVCAHHFYKVCEECVEHTDSN